MTTDREIQQDMAREEWDSAKQGARYWLSRKYTPNRAGGGGSWTYRAWLAVMRNLVVAYHTPSRQLVDRDNPVRTITLCEEDWNALQAELEREDGAPPEALVELARLFPLVPERTFEVPERTFDTVMAVLDEAVDVTPIEELITEDPDAAKDFASCLRAALVDAVCRACSD